jgi:hypothetical protein
MKIAPRTVAAALAAAAIAVTSLMQPVQPAEAAGVPDLRVQFDYWNLYKIEPDIRRAQFEIRNIGTAPSGNLLVVKSCWYLKISNEFSGLEEKALPAVVLPKLNDGSATPVSVDCHRDSGRRPERVTLKVAAQKGEPSTANNQDSAMYAGGGYHY